MSEIIILRDLRSRLRNTAEEVACMKNMYSDSFWKAVSDTAATRGLIDAAVIVYCRVYGMPVSECCSAIGLGAKRVKAVLSEFDRVVMTPIPVERADKMTA